jgi:hypothetical protein
MFKAIEKRKKRCYTSIFGLCTQLNEFTIAMPYFGSKSIFLHSLISTAAHHTLPTSSCPHTHHSALTVDISCQSMEVYVIQIAPFREEGSKIMLRHEGKKRQSCVHCIYIACLVDPSCKFTNLSSVPFLLGHSLRPRPQAYIYESFCLPGM